MTMPLGFSFCAIAVCWSAIVCYAGGPGPDKRAAAQSPGTQFECKKPLADLRRDRLEQIAFDEYKKYGGDVERTNISFVVSSKGCDWYIFGRLPENSPGAHFSVTVDGTTGHVRHFSPGR